MKKVIGLPRWLSGKESVKRHGFDPCFGKIPLEKEIATTPVFLPRKSHGQRTLAGYSPLRHMVTT